MLFVANNAFTSARLRGENIALAMGVRCHFADIGGSRNDVIVFVKETDRGLVEDAKERGNVVIYDIIDHLCYQDRSVSFADLVDIVLIPNRECIGYYATVFPKAKYAVIPHQWDPRIIERAPQDRCRAGYIGKPFNCDPSWQGDRVTKSPEMIDAAPRYNLHIGLNQRDEKQILLKPATKVATAAAVLANVITYPDPSAVELLGADYPYIARDEPLETIRMAHRDFGSRRWHDAKATMRRVRERTSLAATVRLYARLADRDESMLIPRTANRMAA